MKILNSIILLFIKKLYNTRSKHFSKNWQRNLPFSEMLIDRWAKAKFLNFGEGTSIYDNSIVIGDVKVGKNTWIGPFTILDGSGGLEIGNFCSISAGVHIYSHNSVNWALGGGSEPTIKKKVKIGSKVYIGPNAVISMGVSIGDKCIIGANSFVNKDIPNGSKAFGNPAKCVE